MSAEALRALERSELLGILDEDARRELVEAGRVQTAEKDTVLFFAEDPTRDILVLLHGRVRLWRLTRSGHELVLRVCEPGEVLGQMSAIEGGRHSIGATAAGRARLLRVPAARFRELVAARPELAMRLASVLAGRVRDLSDQLEAMKFETIGQRVVRWLETHGAGRRELRTTHQDLAAQVGSNRENVSRVLGLLRDQGLLRLGRGTIEILNHEALARADLVVPATDLT